MTNNTIAAIGIMKPIQSLALPLGDSFTIRFALGSIMKNIATRNTAEAIFNQSITLPQKNKPLKTGAYTHNIN